MRIRTMSAPPPPPPPPPKSCMAGSTAWHGNDLMMWARHAHWVGVGVAVELRAAF